MNETQARELLVDALGGIAPEVDVDALDPDAEIQTAADLDSMDFLALLEALAERTGIEIPEADYPRLASVSGAARYLADRVPTDPART